MHHPGRPSRAFRVVWGLLAAGLAVAVIPHSPVAAGLPDVQQVGRLDTRLPSDADPSLIANLNLIMDSPIRRGYQLLKVNGGRTVGRAFDLDTGKVAIEKTFPQTAFPGGPGLPHTTSNSVAWVHTLDKETHTLYVAYVQGGLFGGITAIDGRTMNVIRTMPRQAATINVNDLGSVSQNNLPQAPTAAPTLMGLAIAPPELTGLTPKLLLLMQEPRVLGTEGNFAVQWLAQWDAETGKQDWIYRISACSNTQLPDYTDTQFQIGVMQSGSGIYVGCLATGGTGQVVRLPVDSTNKPINEQAYPGPLSTVDILTDPDRDHMLLRVSGVKGESWWVFDGPSSSYTGVVGMTLSPVRTGTGLDQQTGRLYTLSSASASKEQRNEGGIQMSDTRRVPAPQPLQFPEFAQDGRNILVDVHPVTGARRIYALPGGETSYIVFADNVPVTYDEPIVDRDQLTIDVEEKPDVTDRNYSGSGHAYAMRTLLVSGLEGAPPGGPNVGVRVGRHSTKLVGSPCGKQDREISVGMIRNAVLANNLAAASASVADTDTGTKLDLGQPSARCYPRPVNPLNGNDLWNQAPVATPYPRPLDTDSDENGTSDVDEYLGSAWSFKQVECSDDTRAATTASAKPLDRGPDPGFIPVRKDAPQQVVDTIATINDALEPARAQDVTAERYTASADCGLSKHTVSARSGGTTFEQTDVPGVGTVSVGNVSTSVNVYLDKTRGLVTRSVAAAGGIKIGDHIAIDLTYAVAESWAAGRSGTASTSFVRRICGLHVKDEAPDTRPHAPSYNVNPNDPTNPRVNPTGGPVVQKQVDINACGDPNVAAFQTVFRQGNLGEGTQPMIELMNRALGSRGRVSSPEPDGELSQGTPGGYLASVQKDRQAQISARAVNNDPSTQVPAFELVVFNDDPTEGRGRQIYQFAGVDASTTYGIFLLNPEEPIFGDPPAPPPPSAPAPTIDGGYTPPQDDTPAPYVPSAGPLTILFSGIGFLLRRPLDALLAAAVWSILYSPVQLAARRRALRTVESS